LSFRAENEHLRVIRSIAAVGIISCQEWEQREKGIIIIVIIDFIIIFNIILRLLIMYEISIIQGRP
jgi:hypothetical protein